MCWRNLSGKLRLSDASEVQLHIGHDFSCSTVMLLLQETRGNLTVSSQALGTHQKCTLQSPISHMHSLRLWPSAHWLLAGVGSACLLGVTHQRAVPLLKSKSKLKIGDTSVVFLACLEPPINQTHMQAIEGREAFVEESTIHLPFLYPFCMILYPLFTKFSQKNLSKMIV